MSYSRVATVTGANKGIGLAAVRQLALQYPKSPSNNGPLLIYLTARNQGRGEEAVKTLHNDAELKKAKVLKADGGTTEIKYHSLDISETNSITSFAEYLNKEHPDGIDIVINNAGIAMDGFDTNVVKGTLKANYYGTLQATKSFLPLLKPSSTSRLVNVSSTAGSLGKYSPALQERFHRGSTNSPSDITALMEDFTSAVAAGNHTEQGWPSAAYSVSKSGVTGMTKAIAHQEKAKGSKVLINACCPGYVDTDMTKHRGVKTIDQGAQTPVMLALADIGGVTGEYWRDEKVREW